MRQLINNVVNVVPQITALELESFSTLCSGVSGGRENVRSLESRRQERLTFEIEKMEDIHVHGLSSACNTETRTEQESLVVARQWET